MPAKKKRLGAKKKLDAHYAGEYICGRRQRRGRSPEGTMSYFHGAHTRFSTHLGLCLTDDEDTARNYAGISRGHLATMELDLAALTVIECEAIDWDANEAPGDDGDSRDADVLVFDDADEYGREHRTWRLMTQAAIDALTVVSVVDLADEDDE
jgi:hypothetical protein